MTTRTVTIFGVFDGIHEGHKEFIKQAKAHGEQLVAIVARDETVLKLKGKNPVHSESERIKMLLEIPEIDLVFLGDIEEGAYKTLKEVNPSIVFLGYDQLGLFDSIKISIDQGILPPMDLVFGTPHKPELYHSSIINENHEPTDEKLSEL